VALRSVEFGGAVPAEVPVEAFHGTVAVRLSFPDGPVSSLEEVPASVRNRADLPLPVRPGHEYRRRQTRRAAGE
jgi:hypothetical protein